MWFLGAVLNEIKAFVFGRDLRRARQENAEAAEKLDAAIREVLNK